MIATIACMGEAHEQSDPTTIHVRAALEGDEASLSWIVERFSPVLIAQARYRMGRQLAGFCEPEDVVNDVWLRAIPRLKGLTDRGGRFTPAVLAYLSTAVIHRVGELVKRRMRTASKPDGKPGDAERSTPDLMDRVPAEMSGVITRAVRREGHDLILEAIEAMEATDREILLLRGVEQRDTQFAARVLEISPDAVAARYSRALKRLRERFRDSIFEEF